MKVARRHVVTALLLAFVAVTAGTLAVKETRHARAVAAAEAARTSAAALTAELPATVVVTYFHANVRCASCLKIEDLASTAVTTQFAVPLAEKRLVWRLVNVDVPENNHFVRDYGLYTKSVVVSEVKRGKVRWKNLDQVWKLLNDPEGFQSYVEREVRDYLGPA